MKNCPCKIFLFGVIYAVIAQVIHTLGAFVTMPYYMIEEYFPVWSKIMMPTAGPPPVSFYLYSLVFSIITGMLIAYVYTIVRSSFKQKSLVKKGLFYGLLVFLVGALPSTLGMILLINLPVMLLVAWAIESLIILLLTGMILAKLIKG